MREITKETILNNLKNFVALHNRIPIIAEFTAQNRLNTPKTILKLFGSIKNLIKEAGFTPKNTGHRLPDNISAERLIEDLKRFAEINKRQPTYNDAKDSDILMPPYQYIKHFGSWAEALRRANLKPNKNKGRYRFVPTETLINNLKEFYITNKRNPFLRDFENKSPGPATYIRRFDTWNKALIAAGLELEPSQKRSYKKYKVNDSWSGEEFWVSEYTYNRSSLDRFFKNDTNRKLFYENNPGRISAFEKYIIGQLNKEFSFREIIRNSRNILDSKTELDIFIKDINLAIEVNGIFHYKKVFVNQELEKVQQKDSLKRSECAEKGINLIVLDTSEIHHATKKNKSIVWEILKPKIQNIEKFSEIKIKL